MDARLAARPGNVAAKGKGKPVGNDTTAGIAQTCSAIHAFHQREKIPQAWKKSYKRFHMDEVMDWVFGDYILKTERDEETEIHTTL